MKKEEIWVDIPQYVGIYQVSNLGRVRSLKFNKIRILKPSINRGYSTVILCKNNITRGFKVHKLVAIAFLNNKPDGTHKIVVDHISNDKSNNRVDNLQLITQRENIIKEFKIKCSSKYLGVSFDKKANKWFSIIYLDKLRYLGRFETEIEASKMYNAAKENSHLFNGNIKEFRENIIKEFKIKRPSKCPSKFSSKYLGVSFDKKANKWFSSIYLDKLRYLGRFETEIEASEMYNLAKANSHLFNGNTKEFREKLTYFVKN